MPLLSGSVAVMPAPAFIADATARSSAVYGGHVSTTRRRYWAGSVGWLKLGAWLTMITYTVSVTSVKRGLGGNSFTPTPEDVARTTSV